MNNKKSSRQSANESHKYKAITICLVAMILILVVNIFCLSQQNVFADSRNIVETNFFGNIEEKDGCGVYTILNNIVDIMTFGIGISAAIGITIVGTKYLTAKGNEEQTRKAKHRMFQIVIGLAIYAVFYVGIQFLLPGSHVKETNCNVISDAELAKIRAEEEKAKKEAEKQRANNKSKTSSSSSSKNGTDLSKWFDAMKKQLDYMKNTRYGANYQSNFARAKTDGTCITYVSTSLQRLGVIPKNTYVWAGQSNRLTGTAANHIKKHKNTFYVFYPQKSVKQLKNTLKVGDIVAWSPNNGNHIMVFMGFNSKGNPIFNSWGSAGGKYKKEYSYYANRKVTMVIRLKKTSI